jgi:hypothetical protein
MRPVARFVKDYLLLYGVEIMTLDIFHNFYALSPGTEIIIIYL